MEVSLRLVCFLTLCPMMLTVNSQGVPLVEEEVKVLDTIERIWRIPVVKRVNELCLWGDRGNADDNFRVSWGKDGCHVIRLNLGGNNLSGPIPEDIGNLTNLEDLDLSMNNLSGPLPSALHKLTSLKFLNVSYNVLNGSIPAEVGGLLSMEKLSFSSNRFSGPIPKALGNLSSLLALYIDSSGLSGNIPPELGLLKNLQILWASDNLFNGKLPESLGVLVNLVDMRIQGTQLEGPIPKTFSTLMKLEYLYLGDFAKVNSTLSFVENLTSLSFLSLRNCQLVGLLPEQLGNFTKLIYLDLSFNNLTGSIPNSFQNLKSLKVLYLGNNNLSGNFPSNNFPASLMTLDVSFNQISGSFHPSQNNHPLSINSIGTSMDLEISPSPDGKELKIWQCLQTRSCKDIALPDSSWAVNCGGPEQATASGFFFDDSGALGAASFHIDSRRQWLVSNTGSYMSAPAATDYTAETNEDILGAPSPELYKKARISPSSLRYFAFGLERGKYKVVLHFAEIVIDDDDGPPTWKALGRRIFDVYIQGKRVLQNFNIQEQAGGSKRALNKTFEADVTDGIVDIHFFWAGRGTSSIPRPGSYGPLVSAIQVSPASTLGSTGSPPPGGVSGSRNTRTGKIAGIVMGFAAVLVILLSALYLWWKKESTEHRWLRMERPPKS